MLYTGVFRSVSDVKYTVEIVTNNSREESVKLTFSSEPVVIETDSDGLFSPIKSKSATITLITKDIYFDLYSSAAQDVPVTIYRNENVIFCGYLSPCVYSQDWDYNTEFELEAVDRLSTLQYYKYEIDSLSYGLQTLSFSTLIRKCLKKAGYSKYFYYPTNSLLTGAGSKAFILDYFGCNESNFFDDDEEATPWTYEDLLTEICNFCGVTCVPYGENVYFIDYACINNNDLIFDKYFVKGNEGSQGKITSRQVTITKDSYKRGTPELSLDEVYNKIEVSCSIYEYGKDAGSLDSELFRPGSYMNILDTYMGSSDYIVYRTSIVTKDQTVPYECNIKMYRPSDSSKWRIRYFESNLINGVPNDATLYPPNKYNDSYSGSTVKLREYTDTASQNWFWAVKVDGSYEGYTDTLMSNMTYNWKIPQAIYKNVPIMIEYNIFKRNNIPVSSSWNKAIMFTPINENVTHRLKEYIKSTYNIADNKIFFGNPRELNVYGPNYAYEYNWEGDEYLTHNYANDIKWKLIADNICPCLEYKDNNDLIYSPKNAEDTAYIYIDGQILYHQDHCYRDGKTIYTSHIWRTLDGKLNNSVFPLNEIGYSTHTLWKRKNGTEGFNSGWVCLKLMVKIGDKYWNGTEWSTTANNFDLSFNSGRADPDKSDSEEKFNLYEWQKIVYNTTYKDQIGKEVYAIPIKSSDELYGKLEIKVYTPHMCTINENRFISQYTYDYLDYYNAWFIDVKECPQHIFLKDFAIEYFYDPKSWSDTEEEENSDIVYFNVIDDDYVTEFDDVELKINTYVDGKEMSRSYNIDPNSKHFVTSVYNGVTKRYDKPEHHIVEKYYNHYATPKKIFTMDMLYDDKNDPGTKVYHQSLDTNFVIDSEEISLVNDIDTVKLVEY